LNSAFIEGEYWMQSVINASAQAPQSAFADVSGARLHYLIAGKGDPVVLLHGMLKPATCGCR
jgi:hypothetical protein